MRLLYMSTVRVLECIAIEESGNSLQTISRTERIHLFEKQRQRFILQSVSILHLPTRFPFFLITTFSKVISSAQAVFKCQADRDHNTEADLAALTLGTFLDNTAEQISLPGLDLEESAARTRRRLQLRHIPSS